MDYTRTLAKEQLNAKLYGNAQNEGSVCVQRNPLSCAPTALAKAWPTEHQKRVAKGNSVENQRRNQLHCRFKIKYSSQHPKARNDQSGWKPQQSNVCVCVKPIRLVCVYLKLNTLPRLIGVRGFDFILTNRAAAFVVWRLSQNLFLGDELQALCRAPVRGLCPPWVYANESSGWCMDNTDFFLLKVECSLQLPNETSLRLSSNRQWSCQR